MSRWIHFLREATSSTRLTEIWVVRTNEDNLVLGVVRWFSVWRKYVFWPEEHTLYEQDCLRAIAEFCEEKTREHKAARKAAAK